MPLLVTYFGVALGISFLCSLLEAVLLSITPVYVARLQDDGKNIAARMGDLKANIDRPLAAILSLNTIANTVGAAGVGAQAQVLWGSEALAIASGALTLCILVLSEIIPKTLGVVFWRRLAPFVVRVLSALMLLLYPLVVLSVLITRAIARPGGRRVVAVSREDLAAMALLGTEAGVIGESESRILRNLFRFAKLRARDIMTPRPVLLSLPETTTVREVIDQKRQLAFSRIPIWRENEDDVVGYVRKDEVLLHAARGELDRLLVELRRELQVVPESISLPALFELLLDRREHIALVTDEYGGVAGVVTMEDAVETLLGMEIVDEADTVQDMREMARARWYRRVQRLGVLPSDFPDPLSETGKHRLGNQEVS